MEPSFAKKTVFCVKRGGGVGGGGGGREGKTTIFRQKIGLKRPMC